jgi:hypothetical protein
MSALCFALTTSLLAIPTASATPLSPAASPAEPAVLDTDMIVAGVGDTDEAPGSSITLTGVGDHQISSVWLYWAGHSEPLIPADYANISFAGEDITGTNIGYEGRSTCYFALDGYAYRADVTALVSGDGVYSLGDMFNNAQNHYYTYGASLVVFYDDGDDANNQDVYVYEGQDSNDGNSDNGGGWDASLANIFYRGGPATLTLHVEHGQEPGPLADDGDFALDGTTLASGAVFQGDSVPSAVGSSNARWDIKSFLITDALTPGTNSLNLTNVRSTDCLDLIVATVSVASDVTPPVLAATITSGGNPFTPAAGTWTNQPVVVTFTCTDEYALAGDIEPTVTATLSTDGAGQQVNSPPCEDAVGHTATPQAVTNINIDQTAPTIHPLDNQTVIPTSTNDTPVFFTPIVSDILTPTNQLVVTCLDQNDQPFQNGQSAPIEATTTITCTVTDLAGNTAETSFTVTVDDPWARLRADTIALVSNPTAERALVATIDQARLAYDDGNPFISYLGILKYVIQVNADTKRHEVTSDAARQVLTDAYQVYGILL